VTDDTPKYVYMYVCMYVSVLLVHTATQTDITYNTFRRELKTYWF